MIVLKLAFLVGLVLASPFLLYQIWGVPRPRRSTRRNGARSCRPWWSGLLLFLVGAVLGYVFVVPQAAPRPLQLPVGSAPADDHVRRLFRLRACRSSSGWASRSSSRSSSPSWPGSGWSRRPRSTDSGGSRSCCAFAAGALLSPGRGRPLDADDDDPDPPAVRGRGGGRHDDAPPPAQARRRGGGRRPRRCWRSGATPASAQEPTLPSRPAKAHQTAAAARRAAQATPRRARTIQSGQAVDTAAARRLGLPTAPASSPSPAPDSMHARCCARPGYVVTRIAPTRSRSSPRRSGS